MALRVTHRSLFTTNVANLQTNLSRISKTQGQLSSGRLLSTPSDDPAGTGAALRHRREIGRKEQMLRNADDGLGWLTTADTTLKDVNTAMMRVRELLVAGNNTVTSGTTAESIAREVEAIRDQVLALSNAEYLGRPIFGGTTAGGAAYDAAGNYVGDANTVGRTVREGANVQVNVTGTDVFGDGAVSMFQYLTDVADHLRNDTSQLDADLGEVDNHLTTIREAWSTVGARYSQIEIMRDQTDEELLRARESLSGIEDIDLPATIVDLQLQETAYQAALSATARSVQPSLLDFLR